MKTENRNRGIAVIAATSTMATASSHGEAPGITFQFDFANSLKDSTRITSPIDGVDVAIPLRQAGTIAGGDNATISNAGSSHHFYEMAAAQCFVRI